MLNIEIILIINQSSDIILIVWKHACFCSPFIQTLRETSSTAISSAMQTCRSQHNAGKQERCGCCMNAKRQTSLCREHCKPTRVQAFT